ncbi:hypothetical protein ANO14919_111970 [Xylariales sp. No.14919]|nr:hypothetical protein ANO14919_111970 [Xylariales sp. No.14919]
MIGLLKSRLHPRPTESHEPLIDEKDEAQTPNNRFLQISKPLLLKVVLVFYVLFSSISLVVLGRNYNEKPYSPVNHVLSYERQALYFGEDPRFTGLPEEVDEAWDYLLEPINIRMTHDELEQSRATFTDEIVQLTDGGYVSVLSVHHELHCLDALRRNIYYSYYYPNATEAERRYSVMHMSHCVDTIRRSLMCKADIAVYTAYWIGDHDAFPNKELRSNSDRICVNWEAIDGWARTRLLPKDKYKVKPGPFEKALKGN